MTPNHDFRVRETQRLLESGWSTLPPLRDLLQAAGVGLAALVSSLTETEWATAARVAERLRERFAGLRFAGEVEYGLLFVPAPGVLDTRAAIPTQIRRAQDAALGADLIDPSLGAGTNLVESPLGGLFVTVVSPARPSAGSWQEVVAASAATYRADGFDTRRAMTRQLWGARVLQAGTGPLPDRDGTHAWTFTLFPAEGLVGGRAVSGTVLKGHVRLRLGKPDRGIGPARVAPAVPVAAR